MDFIYYTLYIKYIKKINELNICNQIYFMNIYNSKRNIAVIIHTSTFSMKELIIIPNGIKQFI